MCYFFPAAYNAVVLVSASKCVCIYRYNIYIHFFYSWQISAQISSDDFEVGRLLALRSCHCFCVVAHRDIFSKSYQRKPKSDSIYHAPIDLEPNGRLFGSKSIGKW